MFINCIDLFCSFVLFVNFKMRIIFFKFSSEAEHVLALFLFLGQIELQCSYKMCSSKKEEVFSAIIVLVVPLHLLNISVHLCAHLSPCHVNNSKFSLN